MRRMVSWCKEKPCDGRRFSRLTLYRIRYILHVWDRGTEEYTMDSAKRKALEAAGWKVGDAADFLEMSDGERQLSRCPG